MQRTRATRQVGMLLFISALVLCGCVATASATASFPADRPSVASSDSEASTLGQVDTRGSPPPNISVKISETPVPDGGEFKTTNDPRFEMNVTSDSTIEIISVRIGQQTRRSYVPNATTFSDATRLKLSPRSNQLSIVVRTTSGTTTYSATVIEDSSAPLMTFKAPISAGFVGPNGTYEPMNSSYTLNKSRIDIAGTIHDQSAVEEVVIDHEYRYWFGGSQEYTDSQIVITDPDDSIEHGLQLGPSQPSKDTGVNTIRITLRDEFGHEREYETDIRVQDTSSPTISILEREPIKTRSAVRIRARASDDTGLSSVGFRPGSANDSYGQEYLYIQRQPANQSLSEDVTTTVQVTDRTKNITLIATDTTGNTTTKQLTVNYTELVSPEIQFDWSTSRSLENDAIQIAGEVYSGQFTRVHVETVDPDGDTIDISSVYSGNVTDRTAFKTRLNAHVYPATVRVRAVDVTGTEHVRTVEVSQSEIAPASTTDQSAEMERPTEGATNETSNTDPESTADVGRFERAFTKVTEVLEFVERNALFVSSLVVLMAEMALFIHHRG